MAAIFKSKINKQKDSYNSSAIYVYKGLDGCRKTPTVYVGETTENGIFKIFAEACDNAIDEAVEGHGKIINVVYEDGYVWVIDEGRGLPIDIHKDTGLSGLETILTQLNAGGKSEKDGEGYKKATFGIFGMGISVTNALSSELQAWSCRKEQWYTQTFKKGKSTSKLIKTKIPNIPYLTKWNKKAGTIIKFKPDITIFDEGAKLSLVRVKDYLDKASYLNKGLKFVYASKKGQVEYYQPKGLVAYLEKLITKNELEVWGKPFIIEADNVSISMQWTKTDVEYMNSLINSGTVKEGGTHITGFNKALNEALSPYAGKRANYKVEDLRAGLVTIINVNVKNPKFSSQVKDKLITPEAQALVYDTVKKPLTEFFSKNKSFSKELVKRASDLAKINEQASMDKKAKASFKSKKSRVGISSKLSPCTIKNRELASLYLCEGDSAAGSMITARDSKFHAILPLRGKVLNVYGAQGTSAKIFANEEIKSLLQTIGYNPDNKESKKFNYGKVIIMADEDVDGCLPSETCVLSLDGTNPSIGEVYKNWDKKYKGKLWVWGRKDSDKPMVPMLATRAIKVMRNRFVRITLDDGTVFESTRSHGWIIKQGNKEVRIKAKELRKGDSIPAVFLTKRYADGTTLRPGEREYMCLLRPWSAYSVGRYNPKSSLNTPTDNEGYPLTPDRMLHHLSFEHFNPKLFKQWRRANSGVNGGTYHIHHKDDNGFNNLSENLEMLRIENHRALHGADWVATYNGSERHLQDLADFRKTEAGKAQLKRVSDFTKVYNKTEKNKESTRVLNRDPEIRAIQTLGAYAKKYLLIKKLGLNCNEKTWNSIKTTNKVSNCLWSKKRNSLREIKNHIIRLNFTVDNAAIQVLEKHRYPTQAKSKFLNTCLKVVNSGKELNEYSYEKQRKKDGSKRNPKWQTGLNIFSSIVKLKAELKVYTPVTNHKIVKVQFFTTKTSRPYYCLEVPESNNFYIQDINGNGVLTGNSHISTLLLSAIQKLVPQLITDGKLFILKGSLFTCEHKGKRIFADTRDEILEKTNNVQPKSGITRLKGWGEAEPEWLETLAFNEDTRKLIKIIPSNTKSLTNYITLVGDGPEGISARCKLVGIN